MNFAEKKRIVFSRTVRSILPAANAASRAYKKCGKKNRALKKTRFFCKFILDRINEFNKSSLNAYSYILTVLKGIVNLFLNKNENFVKFF